MSAMSEPRKATPRELLAYVTERLRAERFAKKDAPTPFSVLEKKYGISHPTMVELVNYEAKSVGPRTIEAVAAKWFGGSEDRLKHEAAGWCDAVGWQDEGKANEDLIARVANKHGYTRDEIDAAHAIFKGFRGYAFTEAGAEEALRRTRQIRADMPVIVRQKEAEGGTRALAAKNHAGTETEEQARARIARADLTPTTEDTVEDAKAIRKAARAKRRTP